MSKLNSYWKSLPNAAHRAEKWSGEKVTKNRKKYSRKQKHKK